MKEKEQVQNVTHDVNPGTSAEPVIPSFTIPKQNKPTTMESAIRAGIQAGRKFKLVRKVYQGKNKKFYFSYSVVVIMRNSALAREIRLTPDLGYVGKNDASRLTESNRAGYSFLNYMYDFGNGADLICREEPVFDRYGQSDGDSTSFNFYAQTADASGICNEYVLKPSTPGDRSMLLGAFSGFGGVRDFDWEDFKNPMYVGILQSIFEGYFAPGSELPKDSDLV